MPLDNPTDKKFLGTDVSQILNCAGGRVFYRHSDSFETGDLRSRAPDGSNDVLLFVGSSLPPSEHFNYLSYRDVQPDGGYVFFTVNVYGYVDEDGWRGHEDYTAKYRVRADGSELTLINEDYLCPWKLAVG